MGSGNAEVEAEGLARGGAQTLEFGRSGGEYPFPQDPEAAAAGPPGCPSEGVGPAGVCLPVDGSLESGAVLLRSSLN